MSSAAPDTSSSRAADETAEAGSAAAEKSPGAETLDRAEQADQTAASSARGRFVWRNNLLLFALTVASVLFTATLGDEAGAAPESATFTQSVRAALGNQTALLHGLSYTVALLAILVAHEFGHYIAARIHRVETSLPFFIPLPVLSPFGTMGAVIRMRGTIPTRRALLDIGASGPLAGITLAIPIYYWGATHSRVVPIPEGAVELGDSLLLKLLDHLAAPNLSPGTTLMLSPFAYAAWSGMFVTMINLLPVGQLDGGHVAYALFGKRQDSFARWIHRAVLAFFCVMLVSRIGADVYAGHGLALVGARIQGTLFWLTWFEMLALLGTLSRKNPNEKVIPPRTRIALTAALVVLPGLAHGRFAGAYWGAFAVVLAVFFIQERKRGVLRAHGLFDHPPTNDAPLGLARSAVAIITLLLFVALFMPTPFSL